MDSRFHIKVAFDIYGQHYDWEASLNWQDSGYDHGIDDRIAKFFRDSHSDAYCKWTAKQAAFEMERHAEATKAQEIAELDQHIAECLQCKASVDWWSKKDWPEGEQPPAMCETGLRILLSVFGE